MRITQRYFQVLARQNGVCAICHHKPARKLIFDYDSHERIRGLLCEQCFYFLPLVTGWAHYQSAQEYLQRAPLVAFPSYTSRPTIAMRRAEVVRELEEGFMAGGSREELIAELAAKYRLSTRTIKRYLHRFKGNYPDSL